MWDFLHSVRPVWEQSWVIKRGNCLTNAVNVETLSLCQIYLNRLEQLDVKLFFFCCFRLVSVGEMRLLLAIALILLFLCEFMFS